MAGNFLGTDPTGTVALPNGDAGVLVDGSNNNTIGGTTADSSEYRLWKHKRQYFLD